jgi:hypothetical protein
VGDLFLGCIYSYHNCSVSLTCPAIPSRPLLLFDSKHSSALMFCVVVDVAEVPDPWDPSCNRSVCLYFYRRAA